MRPHRLAFAALALTAVLAGCADVGLTPVAPPTPAPTVPSVSLGGEGLDVRYLDQDGTIKTLRVEEFPR